MDRTVNLRPLTAKVRVLSYLVLYNIYGGQNGNWTRFSPVSNIPPLIHTHLHPRVALNRTRRRILGTFQDRKRSFENREALECKPCHSFYPLKGQYRKIYMLLIYNCGPGSSVGIATDYGLDGPGIEYRWVEIF